MKDLRLFRILREGALNADDAKDALPLLEELAGLPLEQRFAFLGVLPAALHHEDAHIAAAALRALSGADGPHAFRALVGALSDPREAVRMAALEGLRDSSVGHPARWFHAVFHPDDAIRLAAISGEQPLHTESFRLYLLTDPACRERVLRDLEHASEGGAGEASSSTLPVLPAQMLPVLLELVERGVLSKGIARRLLAAMPWEEAARWFERSKQRSAGEVDAILASAERPEGPGAPTLGAAQDGIDDLINLFWETLDDPGDDADSAGAERAFRVFFNRLAASLQAWPSGLVRRVIASILNASTMRGSFPEVTAGLCAIYHPRFLGFSWVPRSVRYGAVGAIYAVGDRVPRLDDDRVKELLDIDLCWRGPPADGAMEGTTHSTGIDLWVVGGLLHFIRSHPYKRLLRWLSIERVIGAFAEDPEHAAPLLCLKDESKRGRAYILARIHERHPDKRGILLALLALAAPADDLEFLRAIKTGDEAADVVAELFRLELKGAAAMRPKKTAAIAAILGERIASESGAAFLRGWLALPSPETIALGVATLIAMASAMDADRFVHATLELDGARLQKLLVALAFAYSFPFGKELHLAHALASHADEAVRRWALARVPASDQASVERAPRSPARAEAKPLSPAERGAITSASEADLSRALGPCLGFQRVGLPSALADRPPPHAPQVTACAALLGSHDPLSDVDTQFARFASIESAFLSRLDAQIVRLWEREGELPLLGHAWMHRFERHAFALADSIVDAFGDLAEGLRRALALTSAVLCESIWEAVAHVLSMWRWRSRDSLAAACPDGLIDVLIEALTTDVGEHAATGLMAIVASGIAPDHMDRRRLGVARILPDLSDATRAILMSWVESRGLVGRGAPRPRTSGDADDDTVLRIRRAEDLDALAGWCCESNTRVVQEAALRLLEIGEPGAARLKDLLLRDAPPPGAQLLIDTVALWSEGASLTAFRSIAAGSSAPPCSEIRFRMAVALVERGEREYVDHALRAACSEDSDPWFRPEDWERLLRTGVPEIDIAAGLAASPHPHAYRRAVEHLLGASIEHAARAAEGLRAFLEAGTERIIELRRGAAVWLHLRGDPAGFPVLLQRELEPSSDPREAILAGIDPELVRAAIESILMTGPRRVSESLATRMLEADGVDEDARAEAYAALLADATSSTVRSAVVQRVAQTPGRARKLRRLAEAFAWGVHRGRELTGRVFKVEMVSGTELGYTRFDSDRVFVTPLPILREEPHASDIVEGLILHEIGHHMYHRGEGASAAWREAEKGGYFGLLNLVADEHLERNLRAKGAGFGDRLKRLAAYGFQHSAKEIHVAELLDGLKASAFDVLRAARVGLARRDASVRVESGPLLLAMEREGMSFPRFMRALRMGLGNRHKDPTVDAALDLFKGGLRKKSMAELLDVAKALRDLFGWQASLVESFGPLEEINGDPSDQITHGEGITPEELQEEIERVLDPRKAKKLAQSDGRGATGRRWINVSPEHRFDPITSVVKVHHEPSEHARYAAEVARHARRMRAYLDDLGLALEPARRRLAGKRFDRTRTLAVVLRGDPRMLIARERRPRTDLFLGVLIDCSGSMQVGDRIERAKRFGTLLAEAARGASGIDVAIYGFTGDVIYDAGDASHCAAHALVAGGGNNDAAALWHAAAVARASRRRAKLLVMISDGLPTECSADALRAVVGVLGGRMGIVCAQVAVQPLEEICFPSYVVLDETDPDAAVRRFGGIVARLVRKALAGA